MIELQVVNQDGSETETVSISEEVFGGKVRRRLLRDAVVMYGSNKRVGTVKTKGRSEVAGSTRKLFRQKGTGRARAGSLRTPIRVGGGRAHGPKPRDWRRRITRKARKAALSSALLSKFRDGEVVVLESLALPEPKTRIAANMLTSVGIRERCLVIVPEHDELLLRAMRNIPFVRMSSVGDLNAYDVVRAGKLVMNRRVLDLLAGAGQ